MERNRAKNRVHHVQVDNRATPLVAQVSRACLLITLVILRCTVITIVVNAIVRAMMILIQKE